MNTKSSYLTSILSIVLCVITSCSHNEIVLDKVSYIPYEYDYFHSKMHFGKERKAMEEKNEFIFETGKIDTTSESPPIEMGFISINHQTIQLALIRRNIQKDLVNEEYAGFGYELLVTYTIKQEVTNSKFSKGHLIIKHGKSKSAYDVVCEHGYF